MIVATVPPLVVPDCVLTAYSKCGDLLCEHSSEFILVRQRGYIDRLFAAHELHVQVIFRLGPNLRSLVLLPVTNSSISMQTLCCSTCRRYGV